MTGRRHLHRLGIFGAVAAALVYASPASGDILATADTGCPCTNKFELKTVNVTTGATVPQPAGVSSTADENHPSLSPDGRRLVFLRRIQGTVRVVMVDRSTGQSADLFNAFEAAADPPNSPTFSSDGKTVVTGRRLERLVASSPQGALQASFTHTDVTKFPNGPFPHSTVLTAAADSTSPGRTVQPTPFASNRFAFGIDAAPLGRLAVQQASGTATLSDPTDSLSNPTISAAAGVVVYQKGPVNGSKLVFRPLNGIATAPATELPSLVNARDTNVIDPEFSRDGRYLAFIRRPTTGNDGTGRLFVWDTQTQLLLNSAGVYGLTPSGTDSAIALQVRKEFGVKAELAGSLAGFSLAQDTDVGIIVQQVIGTTTVLGRKAPKLRLVGRVALGTFKQRSSKRHVRWNRMVGGRKLPRGEYLVTLRSLTRKGQVRDQGAPVRIKVR